MTEIQRIESAIRAGCDANSVGWICLYPRCQESTECDMRQTVIAAIRAYLVASREPSNQQEDVFDGIAVIHNEYGEDAFVDNLADALIAVNDAKLTEFDAACAELRK